MKISLYLDEDAQDNDLIHALRLHSVDVVKAWDAGMREREDEEHLLFATAQGRVLFGFNAGDYQRLHTEFLTQGRSHAGIVLSGSPIFLTQMVSAKLNHGTSVRYRER
ncbi:MAG: DUF5615 family PIN-like protein [Blastocatellia bacterium]